MEEFKRKHKTPDLHCVLDLVTETETPIFVTCVALTISCEIDDQQLLKGLVLVPAQNNTYERAGMFWAIEDVWERESKHQPHEEFTII